MKVLEIVLLFLMSVCFLNMRAQEYDINDPRNPNCPCHKMQQQADEEFALQNKQIKNNNFDNILEPNLEDDKQQVVDNKSIDEEHAFVIQEKNGNSIKSSSNYKKKRKSIWVKKRVFRFINKYKFKKKERIHVALCYKW